MPILRGFSWPDVLKIQKVERILLLFRPKKWIFFVFQPFWKLKSRIHCISHLLWFFLVFKTPQNHFRNPRIQFSKHLLVTDACAKFLKEFSNCGNPSQFPTPLLENFAQEQTPQQAGGVMSRCLPD